MDAIYGQFGKKNEEDLDWICRNICLFLIILFLSLFMIKLLV